MESFYPFIMVGRCKVPGNHNDLALWQMTLEGLTSFTPALDGDYTTTGINYQLRYSRSPHRSRRAVKDQLSGAFPPCAKELCPHAR